MATGTSTQGPPAAEVAAPSKGATLSLDDLTTYMDSKMASLTNQMPRTMDDKLSGFKKHVDEKLDTAMAEQNVRIGKTEADIV